MQIVFNRLLYSKDVQVGFFYISYNIGFGYMSYFVSARVICSCFEVSFDSGNIMT